MTRAFNIRMRCVVTKLVYCEGPDEATVRENPWDHAVDENEIDQEDWTVLGVEEVEK